MSDYIKEKIKEFREKFLMKGSECTWETYPNPEEIESFLTQSLQEMEERTREAERERIVKVFEGSYPTTLELFGSSTVERMKDVVYKALSPSEEKPLKDTDVPKKEKRGR